VDILHQPVENVYITMYTDINIIYVFLIRQVLLKVLHI